MLLVNPRALKKFRMKGVLQMKFFGITGDDCLNYTPNEILNHGFPLKHPSVTEWKQRNLPPSYVFSLASNNIHNLTPNSNDAFNFLIQQHIGHALDCKLL